uniref:Uncharacterized protein n=1 Tax=Anguilla anguilla TaxID=7936 RepID=A0A0E9QTY0_ANGAN
MNSDRNANGFQQLRLLLS